MRDDIKINERAAAIQDKLVEKLERIYDPDVELDVYNLGLIYEINLDENGHCKIVMTFTDTACDCAESLPIAIMDSLGPRFVKTPPPAFLAVWHSVSPKKKNTTTSSIIEIKY